MNSAAAQLSLSMTPASAVLTPRLVVPANTSRFLEDPASAQRQPVGAVELVWDVQDPYVQNRLFDADLIAHDDAYCTTQVDLDQVQQLPTALYFSSRVGSHLKDGARVIDIGCGRGEFVEHLRADGFEALGYDPVLATSSEHLRNRYWTPEEEEADLFVMRCVLPHIPAPWSFVRALGVANPGALLLVEFQRREWIIEQRIWYQLSHDHVNVFSIDDFAARFDVVESGTFSDGEWGWVLLRADSWSRPAPLEATPHLVSSFMQLIAERERSLAAAASLDRPLYLWGAAGKGILLAHALQQQGAKVAAAIDADPMRQGRFMEVSGLAILSPAEAERALPPDALILVCNPNHLADIRASRLIDRELVLSRDLGTTTIELPRDAQSGDREEPSRDVGAHLDRLKG